jgi:hypothetical protein
MSPQEQRQPPAGRWEVLSAGELPELVGVSSLRLSAGFPTLRHFFPANLQVAPIVGAKAASRRPPERRDAAGNAQVSNGRPAGGDDLSVLVYDGAEASLFL